MDDGWEGRRLVTDEIVVSLWPESWSDLVAGGLSRPPGRLVESLIGADTGSSLYVVNPPRSVVIRTAKRLTRRAEPALPAPIEGRAQLVEPLVVRRRRPTDPEAVAGRQAAFDRAVRRRLARHDVHRPSLVTFSPLVAGYCDLDWAGSMLYYARDDWAAHPAQQRWRAAHEQAYRRIRERGMPVVAVSPSILERMQPQGPSMVLPNGIDEHEWLEPVAPPPWVVALPQPLMVYVGMLDGRIDVAALEGLRRRHPQGSLVLAGPRLAGNDLATLEGDSNVHVVHLADRRSVVGLVAAADVCLVPHRRTALTEAMNPLKLYEYLAAGRPTAATDLPGLRHIHPSVVLCHEGADFADAVDVALARGPMDEGSRLAFIEANRWGRRHDQLLAMLRSAERS